VTAHRPEPLTAAAFAPFGQVHTFHAAPGQNVIERAFDRTPDAGRPVIALVNLETAATLPLELHRLERHPHSAQTFVPLTGARCLIAVCGNAPDGSPDLATLRLFVAGPDQAVTYDRAVWHHGITVLQAPSAFVMAMAQTGRNDDTEFHELPAPLQVLEPAAAGR